MNRLLISRAISVATLSLLSVAASAQTSPKSITPVPAFEALQQWLSAQPVPAPSATPWGAIQTQPLSFGTQGGVEPIQGTPYQPAPVIKGIPDLPLLGATANQAGKNWAGSFNYQGLSVRLWVTNGKGSRTELRSLAKPIKPGERFKIQVTPTFPAVAAIDRVIGEVWTGQRVGQAYPMAGKSVAIRAGESVTLPLGDKEFFVMNAELKERFVLSVKHEQAKGDARSNQPVYRQDTTYASQYLQLIPQGTYPAIEQQLGFAK